MKKFLTTLLITVFIFTQATTGVLAIDPPSAPTPPPAPTAPPAPTSTPEPTLAPTPPPAPTAPPAPGAPGSQSSSPSPSVIPSPSPTASGTLATNATNNSGQNPAGTQSSSNSQPTANSAGSNQVGDSEINTGNANTNVSSITTGNDNYASTPSVGGGATIVSEDNGSGSDNNGSINIASDSTSTQNNSANVSNNLTGASVSGDNSASGNVGNSEINTGNANVSGMAITAVNTNVDGVSVNEFNIVDDHVGDIILDFGTGCIFGCGGEQSVANTGNGSESINNGTIDNSISDVSFQNNDAVVGNNLILSADSGNNETNDNTKGDSEINTGNANVSANSLTFANNNISGNVIYSVVNVFGDLVGDIIFPSSSLGGCSDCGTDMSVSNISNGAGSENNASITNEISDNTTQFNSADIDNNVLIDANTGGNLVSDNTNGNNEITTGNIDADVNVLNVANNNVSGDGDWWLVIVNEAGNWVGKIFGLNGPMEGDLAASEGTTLYFNEDGELIATNDGNGSDSTNNASINNTSETTTSQTNNAQITNNLNLSANTGSNSASRNTGGDNSITTGNANIVANIVNFVNNNISGSGKLYVTVVNVFGSWVGDFLTPGASKPEVIANAEPQIEGNDSNNSQEGNNHRNNQSTQQNNGGETGSSSPVSAVFGVFTQYVSAATSGGILNIPADDPQEALVLGDEANNLSVNSKKYIRLNAAWLVLLLPVGFYVLRKRLYENTN